jgi:hypothetical protein
MDHWTASSRRLATLSAAVVAVVGVAYLAVIGSWLVRVGSPQEPIGDPFLLWMEVLTILSAVAIAALATGMWARARSSLPLTALWLLVSGLTGSVMTIGVHWIELSAVRPLWRAGRIEDYRLIWPSVLFAVEYLAWDVAIGLFMLCTARVLRVVLGERIASVIWGFGGVLCLVGTTGPASGAMVWQNVAVVGYAILLPAGAALLSAGVRRRAREPGSPWS